MQHQVLASVLYVGAMLWWLCHPWASFSTGELKARQLYVDENALVVQALVQEGTDSRVNSESLVSLPPLQLTDNHLQSGDICRMIDGFGATACASFDSEGFPSVTQVVVDSVSKPIRAEATAFVLPYKRGNNSKHFVSTILVRFVHKLMDSSTWLSKRVVILLVGMDCSYSKSSSDICTSRGDGYYSKALDIWLRKYVGEGDVLDGDSKRVATPLIREAFVMELSSGNNSNSNNAKKSSSVSTLHFNGVNGALPNMDMISSALALFPDTLAVTSNDYEGSNRLVDPVSLWYSFWPKAVDFTLNLLSRSGRYQVSIAASNYRNNLSGLSKSSETLARGGGDGLHSQFVEKNIDSITIRSTFADERGVEMMLLLARVSSNLYEELHHSHFFYVLMGSRHFVGLSEYCGPMGLVLLAFFVLFVRSLEKGLFETPRSAFAAGLICALIDTVPAALVMMFLLIPQDKSNAEYLVVLLSHCSLVWIGALLFHRVLSSQEFQAYASVMVLLMQMSCLITASVHFTLSFPVSMIVVPIAWFVFQRDLSCSSPSPSMDRFVYIACAFLVGPSTLLLFFREALNTWISSWKIQYAWNLPLLYCIMNALCCGALRRQKVELK